MLRAANFCCSKQRTVARPCVCIYQGRRLWGRLGERQSCAVECSVFDIVLRVDGTLRSQIMPVYGAHRAIGMIQIVY
jgi:hypothetical protein